MPIPDANGRWRPFLDWVLSGLADVGVRDVVLIVPPDHAAWRAYYEGDGRPARVAVRYAVQAEPLGTAQAVLTVEGQVPSSFLVLNGDNLYPPSALDALVHTVAPAGVAFDGAALVARSNIPAARLRAFARLDLDAEGWLTGITEKPEHDAGAPLDWAISMNCWHVDARIFAACRAVPRSARGEYELPQAIDRAVREGTMRVRAVRCTDGVLDLSGRDDVADVATRLRALPVAP